VESARPPDGYPRETNVALKGSVATAVSGSSGRPSTRSSRRERIRVSRKNSPWAPPVMMSPAWSLMAKVDSSTRVTVPRRPPSPATFPA
jgi:hypothetical protein